MTHRSINPQASNEIFLKFQRFSKENPSTFFFLLNSDPDPDSRLATAILRFQFWHQPSQHRTVRRCFWSILGFHYQPVSFIVLTKTRSNCCKLPVKGPVEDEKKYRKQLQAYLLLIEFPFSLDAAVELDGFLSELDVILLVEEENREWH